MQTMEIVDNKFQIKKDRPKVPRKEQPKPKPVNSVKNLICNIKVMYYNNDPMLNSVDDVNVLYNALCELDEIIGMCEVKESIIKQIKFLMINHSGNSGNEKNKFENHMLHTVVFGPPGVGKTTVGSCLANIWKGLGLIDKKKITERAQKQIFSGRNIRILPIPIFLMKDNRDAKDEDSEEHRQTKIEEDTKHLENSIKNYLNEHSSNTEIILPEKYNSESKYIGKKRKVEKDSDSKSDFNTEIKNSIKLCDKSESDDMKKYIRDLSDCRMRIRKNSLLKFGIKNLMKNVDTTNNKPNLKRQKVDTPIKIVSRPDFVGQYIGHTCDKTQKLLTATLEEGKVLFIDEAYSIVLDEKDSFGHEALNELNRFMSEHPELVVIFAGYKDKMEQTLFKYQPGFKRRCTWVFEISNYTGEMLMDIFKRQLGKDEWKFDGDSQDLTNFFTKKIKQFDAFGGDTIRLALYCKLKYSEMKFDFTVSDKLKDKTISMEIVLSAFEEMYSKNKPEEDEYFKNYIQNTMYI